jgi:DNA-binding MarR family transcriptional regulator/N-acetylglutamate synthase-like GNAT family acetyltransferase
VGSVAASQVEAVRAFSRFYTSVTGVLEEGLLRTHYSVTEARIIFELAQRDRTELADLRRGLGVDAGYMSRITARFETDGLITRAPSSVDGRRQSLRLTDRGREVYATLDSRSAAQVAALLDGVPPRDRRRLVEAMGTIRDVLDRERRPGTAVVLRTPAPGDYGWVVGRHGALYAAEYGWDVTFEALVARIVADYVEDHDPAREAAWIAERDGEPVGCVFCVAKDATTAQLRILLVEPAARGLGVGTRLVDECLRFAHDAGYDAITLWTNDVLSSARRIYEAAGFELTDEEPHHSFGQDLVGQNWERAL